MRNRTIAISVAAVVFVATVAAFGIASGSKGDVDPVPAAPQPTQITPEPPGGGAPITPYPYDLGRDYVVPVSPDETGGGYLEENQGGDLGSDGTSSYYFDPDSGCSVVPGEGTSC